MHTPSIFAMFIIATSSLFTGATAQNIYKCGETYSPQNCPGGVLVNAADKRNSEQKSQADLATVRDTRTGNAMESARLQQEARDLAANTPAIAKPVKKTTRPGKKPKSIRVKAAAVKKTKPNPKKTHTTQPVRKS